MTYPQYLLFYRFVCLQIFLLKMILPKDDAIEFSIALRIEVKQKYDLINLDFRFAYNNFPLIYILLHNNNISFCQYVPQIFKYYYYYDL